MPPQKNFKKNAPIDEDNGISHTLETSHIIDQERRAKLEDLQKARAEKMAHTLEQLTEQDAHENDEDNDDEAIDRDLELVQQKIQQLQKEKEQFANQLQAKR
jgi:hypothetical protein